MTDKEIQWQILELSDRLAKNESCRDSWVETQYKKAEGLQYKEFLRESTCANAVTIREAAKIFNVPYTRVYEWIITGRLEAIQTGRKWSIPLEGLHRPTTRKHEWEQQLPLS